MVDWMPMSDFRATFEVNVFAMIAMTKACLPLLKQVRARPSVSRPVSYTDSADRPD